MKTIYITYYDISKAYDNVSIKDMLVVMWQKGIKGKLWRILKELSMNQKAKVKTKYGYTRTFDKEIGGRQESRLTGKCFAKLMDLFPNKCSTPSNLLP